MFDQINWEMLIAFTVLLTFHGSIFLKLAQNIFITKKEHRELSKKMNDRLFHHDGQPIYVPQSGCDRRSMERDKRRDAVCQQIEELRKEIKELRDLILKRIAIIGTE